MLDRLVRHWVYGGFLAGVLLLTLTPVLTEGWSAALRAVFLVLPIYMLHQYEEHDDDRFRRFVNRTIGGGGDVLSPAAVFVVNVPGVWGVVGLSLWAASAYDIGFGLIAIYLTLVNAVVHAVPAVRFRCYNPGLVTAIVLFLPLGAWGLAVNGGGTVAFHALGLAVAIGIHAAIFGSVVFRRSRVRPGAGAA